MKVNGDPNGDDMTDDEVNTTIKAWVDVKAKYPKP